MGDLRPPLAACFAPFRVTGTVTPLGGAPLTADVVWQAPQSAHPAIGADPDVLDLRPRLRLRRDQVAALPIGSTIQAPAMEGGSLKTYTVERVEDLDAQVLEAVVQ